MSGQLTECTSSPSSEPEQVKLEPVEETVIIEEETCQLFVHGVLTEALDNGTPVYYNSNILGRYYRKDYFDYDKTNSSIDSTDID